MLPGIAVALVVAGGLVVGYRSKRPAVVALVWLAIILFAALFGWWAKTQSRVGPQPVGKAIALTLPSTIYVLRRPSIQPHEHLDDSVLARLL
jgi:hypothetical protein